MAGRTWERPIKVPRRLSVNPADRQASAATTLRADEQVAIPHEVRGIHSARLAMALDASRELGFESGPRVLPRDLDQLGPDSDDVVLRDHPDELPFLNDGSLRILRCDMSFAASATSSCG